MTDHELAEWLGLSPEEALIVIPKLTAEQRAMWEHMHTAYTEIMLWQKGLGALPKGVIVKRQR